MKNYRTCAMMYSMKRTNFYYPEQMLAKLKELSAKTGTPVSELIRRAVDAFLRKHKETK